jgi:hypothetical protein
VKKSENTRGGFGDVIIRWVNKIPIISSAGSV